MAARDPRLDQADRDYGEWLKTQGQQSCCDGIRHPAVLQKARPLQGNIDYRGIPVSVETGRSRSRQWYDPHNQTHGISRMSLPYGYARGTMATDGDQLDVLVGPDREAPEVYVVHINKAPDFTEYDEDKCFLGLRSPEEAMRHFRAMYDNPRFFAGMSIWDFDAFKEAAYGSHKGKKMESGRSYLPPPESPNGMVGAARLITMQELYDAAERGGPGPASIGLMAAEAVQHLRKSGEGLCKQIGDAIGVDWQKYSLDEFCDGMLHEQEHADVVGHDDKKIAQIVLQHLDEDPHYYSHLQDAKDAGIIKERLEPQGG